MPKQKKQVGYKYCKEKQTKFKGVIFMNMMSKNVISDVMSADIKTVSSAMEVCNGKEIGDETVESVAIAVARGTPMSAVTPEAQEIVGAIMAETALGKLIKELFD